MKKFNIGQKVYYNGRKAAIAGHRNGFYALWDETGKKGLIIKGQSDLWIPECELSIRKDDTRLLDRIIDIGQDGSLSDEEARVKMLDIALKEYPQED